MAKVYNNKSFIQLTNNDYLGGELSSNQAIRTLENVNKKEKIKIKITALTNLGISQKELFNFDEAIKTYNTALDLINKSFYESKDYDRAICYYNLANLQQRIFDFKKAKYYFTLVIKYKRLKVFSPALFNATKYEIARCEMNMGAYKNLPRAFVSNIKISDSLNDFDVSFYARYNLTEFYLIKKDTLNAQKYANEALLVARKSKVPYDILNGLRQVGYTDKKKAQQCIDEYDKKTDSIFTADRKARNQFYKIQLDVDGITQEKETAIKQKWVVASMLSGILLIVILLFIIIRQKYKQKEAKLIQGQQRANEETYQLMLNQQALQEEAKTIEKKRIALELHDNILNKLASIRFNLYSLSQKNDAKTIQNALTHVDKIKGVEDEIRTITHDFSNDIFAATYSFKIILEQLIAEQNKLYPKTKYHLELEEGINWDTISSKIKMNLYRIIQEALYNIHKHAKATKAVVALIQDENNICMSIQDNGIGFDVSKIKEGIGIKNIKLRISQLSGKITINSSTKYGTAINVAVPIVTISQ